MSETTNRLDPLRRWICKSYCSCGSREGHYELRNDGAWVLYTDALAEINRLRAEVERLAQERSTVARNPYADQNRALVAEIATRRGITLGHLREDGGCELAQIMRRLDKAECMGEVAPSERLANLPKRAYYETHDPPHCPTCGCER